MQENKAHARVTTLSDLRSEATRIIKEEYPRERHPCLLTALELVLAEEEEYERTN